MSKRTEQNKSRRAFLTRAGGVAAALVAADLLDLSNRRAARRLTKI